jgi:hypothetical protein
MLVAAGITFKELRPVSIMALAMFIACLALSLMASGGFAYFSTQKIPVFEAVSQFLNEPRQPDGVKQAIERWHTAKREYEDPRRENWMIVTNGDEILARTKNCEKPHLSFERSECDEWTYLQAEKQASAKTYGGKAEAADPIAAIFSPSAMTFGRHFSAWASHALIVAVTAIFGTIVFGCAYVLTKGQPVPATAPLPGIVTAPTAPPQQDEIEQAFSIWKERLLWDATLNTRAQELYNDFRAYCRSIGKVCWMTKDGTTPPRFGQAMEPLLRAKKVSTDTSNGTIYRGVGLPGARP